MSCPSFDKPPVLEVVDREQDLVWEYRHPEIKDSVSKEKKENGRL
jgi:hypothetical protein